MQPNYPALVQHVSGGFMVPSRYGDTYEVLEETVRFDAGEYPQRPNINTALGCMELVQLLAGVFEPAALMRVAPKADHSLFTYPMAYGPRLVGQLPLVLKALANDPLTRQANLMVATPGDGPTSNQPCTTHIQFLIRGKRLWTMVGMRSWDIIKGLPYDAVMFGGLAMTVASILNIEAGEVCVRAGSMHLYIDDIMKTPQYESKVKFAFEKKLEATWQQPGQTLMDRLQKIRGWAETRVYDQEWKSGFPKGINLNPPLLGI